MKSASTPPFSRLTLTPSVAHAHLSFVESHVRAQNSRKNFRTVGITSHTPAMCTPVWTTWDEPSKHRPLVSQPRPFPQPPNICLTLIHRYPTRPHRRHPAQTLLHPQRPQALLLLLVNLPRKFFEEASWGTHRILFFRAVRRTPCRRDRLAFKLGPKALRWFSDSRYGRPYASFRGVLRHQEIAA